MEPPPPSGAAGTGFDSTGSIRRNKQAKRNAGEPWPEPPQTQSRPVVPQFATRASYAEAYRPEDAPRRRPRPAEEDPYEPVGLRIGSVLLRPSVEVTRGFDSNPSRGPNGKSSPYIAVEPALQLRSQWSRHEYGADLRGSFTRYDNQSSSNQPRLEGKTYTRLDVARDTRLDIESRYTLGTDHPGSPNLPADIAELPIYMSYGTSVGLTQRLNRLELLAKAGIDRTWYQDSKLTDGTTFSNQDRDYDQYSGQARASYQLTPGVKPFVELMADARRHEVRFDRNGLQRDSDALTPRVGTTFELSQMLTGEISAGYLVRRYRDPSLPDLRGAVADASLIWKPTALTTATLTANSRADESTVAGVSGALRRDAAVQIDHAFRRWLIATVKFGYGFDQYVGSERDDTRMSIGAALTYKVNRQLSVRGEYRHERLRSSEPNVDYDADVFLIGLKLQR